MTRYILIILILALAASSAAQTSSSDSLPQVRAYRKAHAAEILRDYSDFLAIPDLASDAPNIQRNAERIEAMMRARGIEPRLLTVEGAPPVVYGEITPAGAARTLIIYAHYDGQPVDPAQWQTPPWQPVFRDQHGNIITLEQAANEPEARIYARAASDDKAPIESYMVALDALKAAGAHPTINVKFFFEGEEEAGSPHLPHLIEKYRDLLKADAWLICDGPVHQSRKMQVYFGARGDVALEMTVYGPIRQLHSGHYGNWAPNPAAMLVNLLAAIRDDNAHIKVPHFYDDVRPITPTEEQALAQMPNIDAELRNELEIGRAEMAPLNEAIMQPAFNIRGLNASLTGAKATNSIMTEAHASIDIRLVPNETPEHVKQLVEDFVRAQGYFIVHDTPDAQARLSHPKVIRMDWEKGYPAARSDMSSPVAQAVVKAIERATGYPIYKMPTLGGSVPMYLMTDVVKTPAIGVPIANHDNNQHAANENLRLQNLWDGIDVFAAVLTQK